MWRFLFLHLHWVVFAIIPITLPATVLGNLVASIIVLLVLRKKTGAVTVCFGVAVVVICIGFQGMTFSFAVTDIVAAAIGGTMLFLRLRKMEECQN